ncbi:MAG: sodium:calcium antiporter [Candidatus Cloacimonadota bacterium]|nr:MAG: sodium:calcium antiporter [Candidatus Cloacimonadota bacterium]
MLIAFGLTIIGFVLLVKSADWLVDGSASLAKRLDISEIAIGLTVVAFGTSAPELIVNIIASFKNYDEIAFGNIIGSNIFNVLMVLGIAGLIRPIFVLRNTVLKEVPFVLASTILVFLLANNFGFSGHTLSRLDGFILLVAIFLFFIYVFGISKDTQNFQVHLISLPKSIIFIVLGIIGLFVGGKLVVTNAVKIAEHLHVSEKFIALTIVALGTSLPEMVTSIISVLKKHNNIAIGNVLGSNIFNLLLVLGISSIIHPLEFDPLLNIDFLLLILTTLILFFTLFLGKKHKIYRLEAIAFLILYLLYLIFLFHRK